MGCRLPERRGEQPAAQGPLVQPGSRSQHWGAPDSALEGRGPRGAGGWGRGGSARLEGCCGFPPEEEARFEAKREAGGRKARFRVRRNRESKAQ